MGDCAEIAGLNLPFVLPIMHQAAALAKTLAGTPTALAYPAMPVMVKTPACPTVVCPPTAGSDGAWTCQPVESGLQAFFHSPGGTLLGFAPVSYTHLDVYKRQLPSRWNYLKIFTEKKLRCLTELWKSLGFTELKRVFRRTRPAIGTCSSSG